MKTTLLSALQTDRHAIYRSAVGCYLVECYTSVGNGYTVFFNSNPDTPINYRNPRWDPTTDNIIRIPFIDCSEETGNWYRNFRDLEIGLAPYSAEKAWESVRTLKVEKGGQG